MATKRQRKDSYSPSGRKKRLYFDPELIKTKARRSAEVKSKLYAQHMTEVKGLFSSPVDTIASILKEFFNGGTVFSSLPWSTWYRMP